MFDIKLFLGGSEVTSFYGTIGDGGYNMYYSRRFFLYLKSAELMIWLMVKFLLGIH